MASKKKYPIGIQVFPNNEVRKGFADCLSKRIAKEK